MKVSVTKSSNNKVNYRTPLEEIDGMPEKPQIGRRLLLTSSTFESGGILTSEVQDVEESEEGFIVRTEFSTYVVTIVKEQ